MLEVNLCYMGSFDSQFKGNKYIIYQFVDLNSMTIITGTNLNDCIDLTDYVGKEVTCFVKIKGNALKVDSIKTK